MKRSAIVYGIATAILFQAGCTSLPRQTGMPDTLKFYTGSDRPTNEVAVLFIRGPLKYIPPVDEPDLSLRFFMSWDYKIALKPGTYTRSFFYDYYKAPTEHSSGYSISLGPSSPVTFTLEAGRQYAVLYTLKPDSTNQSLGLNLSHKDLKQIRQTKDTNDVQQFTFNSEPLRFTPFIVDITSDTELVKLVKTSSDWLLRWYALDLINTLDCVDLAALAKDDPNENVRQRAQQLSKRKR